MDASIQDRINILSSVAIARAISVSIMFPFDTLKSRRQNNTITQTSLYKGYTYAISTQSMYAMIVFGTYENIKIYLLNKYPNTSHLHIYLGTAIASDMLGSIFLTPCEVIKQNIQVGRYHNVSDAFHHLGLRGLYKGYISLIARDLPFRAIQLTLYDNMKETYDNTMVLGAVAGMTAAAITNPIDVVKTKIMCGQRNIELNGNLLRNLVSGLPYRMAYLGGASAIYFIVYEKMKKYLFR
jgi:solute carrier family 25 S-adenosylmethionine transporter 26